MANIPLGNFDAPRVGVRSGPSRVDNSGTEVVGRAIERVGAQAANIGQNMIGEATQVKNAERVKAEQEADALGRAKAANALASHSLQVAAAADGVADDLRTGGDYTQADSKFEEAVGKIEVPQIDGLDPAVQEAYNGGIANQRQAGKLKMGGLVTAARKDDGQRQFGTLLDTLGKAAGVQGADVAAINAQARASIPLFRAFGMDGSQIDKAVQDFEDRNWTNQVTGRYNAGNGDLEQLRALQAELTDNEGGYAGKLDPDKRNILAGRVGQRIDALEGKLERKADKTDALVERTFAMAEEQIASGVPFTMEQRASMADVVKVASPEQREQFVKLAQSEAEVQKLLRLPIDQQLAAVNERQAAMYAEGGDKRDRANLARVRTAVEANVKALRETPLLFAQTREGEAVEPIDLAGLATPEGSLKVGTQLQDRAQLVGELRKQYGPQVRTRLLLPQEAATLVAAIDTMPPKKRVELFGQLRRLTASDATYLSVMQQIAPDAPVVAFAGMLTLRGERGQKNADQVIAGEALINRSKGDGADDGKFKALKLPSPAEFDAIVTSAVGAAFRGRPEAYAIASQVVRAGYTGAAAADGDVSGVFNQKRLENVIKGTLGETLDYNGRGEVFTPYGMEPDDFEDRLEAKWTSIRGALPPGVPTDIDNYGLQQAGDGRYYVTAGRMFVKNKNGDPLILEVK